jgi:hypothetical protein
MFSKGDNLNSQTIVCSNRLSENKRIAAPEYDSTDLAEPAIPLVMNGW